MGIRAERNGDGVEKKARGKESELGGGRPEGAERETPNRPTTLPSSVLSILVELYDCECATDWVMYPGMICGGGRRILRFFKIRCRISRGVRL